MPRIDDWDLVPALLGEPVADWLEVERAARKLFTDDLVAQGRLLGLAIATDRELPVPPAPFLMKVGKVRLIASTAPLVVDLSALWAGPLAAALLGDCGARVVKVESVARPDGARGGHAAFFNLLNADKASVALDFGNDGDLARLRQLIDRADIVIEGTRPRALAQLGIDAEEIAQSAVWVSITGHGREGDAANWTGFGDDAAVAGGLSAAMARAWGGPLFAGDAIADPLTGITAALAAWSLWRRGRTGLISIALADVVAHARGLGEAGSELPVWAALAASDTVPLYPLRASGAVAPSFGAHTDDVFASL